MEETKIKEEANKHEHHNSGNKPSEQRVDTRYRIDNNISHRKETNTKFERDTERNKPIPRREANRS